MRQGYRSAEEQRPNSLRAYLGHRRVGRLVGKRLQVEAVMECLVMHHLDWRCARDLMKGLPLLLLSRFGTRGRSGLEGSRGRQSDDVPLSRAVDKD